ncbi:MAG TPA: MBL fold metallo-hydrolase, partial [Gemmatimonadales bacterium]|nr:MBL fold metallo-hydrolase [Gemmatimonadales bacterium]
GLPFFAAGDRPDAEVTVVMPAQGDPANVLARVMSPPHFPIKPSELKGKWRFLGIQEGPRAVEGFDVVAREIPHKGGLAYGYRVTGDGATIAYLSDHGPIAFGPGPAGLGAYHPAAIALARGADLLIHDAQLTKAEAAALPSSGHSAVEYAVGLAEAAGARRLLLFHHDPARTDDQIDLIVAAHRGNAIKVEAAAEGTVIDLG